MELSINAIVTLVIAMTILAFGLGMINGVLSFGGSSLAQAVDGYRLDFPATSSDPLVSSRPIIFSEKKSNIILVSFYNTQTSRCDVSNSPSVGAWFDLACPDISFSRVQTVPLDVSPGSYSTLGVSVDLTQRVKSGTYTCFARIYCGNRGDLVSNSGIFDGDVGKDLVEVKSVFVRME